MKKIFLSVLCLSFVIASNTSCQSKTESVQLEKTSSDVVTENISNRRSIRSYQAQQVSKDNARPNSGCIYQCAKCNEQTALGSTRSA